MGARETMTMKIVGTMIGKRIETMNAKGTITKLTTREIDTTIDNEMIETETITRMTTEEIETSINNEMTEPETHTKMIAEGIETTIGKMIMTTKSVMKIPILQTAKPKRL